MRFLGIMLVFAGYVFVYASVAAGGRYATDPMAVLFSDAYTDAELNQMLQDVVRNPSRYPQLTPTPPNVPKSSPTPQRPPLITRHGGTF